MALVKCPDCGKMVSERAAACPSCGCPKDYFIKNDEQQSLNSEIKTELSNTELVPKEVYKIMQGLAIEINCDQDAYRNLYNEFYDISGTCANKFAKYYREYTSLQDVVEKAPHHSLMAIEPALRLCVQKLIEKNIFTVNEDLFYRKYIADYETITDSILCLSDQLASLLLTQEEAEEYRELRKQGRGKWVGGGFGVGGAIKGAVTAGAMNMVTGFGHSIFNGIGNMLSEDKVRKQINAIFSDPDTERNIELAIFYTIWKMPFALSQCICDYSGNDAMLKYAVSDEKEEMAALIIKNAESVSDREQKKMMYKDAIALNPFSDKLYSAIYNEYGDANGDLERLARNYLCHSVSKEKERLLKSYLCSLPCETLDQAKAAYEKLQLRYEQLNMIAESNQIMILKGKIKELDIQARTVGNMLFDTIDEAEYNRKEFERYSDVVENVDYDNTQSLIEALNTIASFSGKLAEQYKETFNDSLNAIELEQRTVYMKSFSNESEDEIRIVYENVQDASDAKAYMEELETHIEEKDIFSYKAIQYYQDAFASFVSDNRTEQFSSIFDNYIEEIRNRYRVAVEQQKKYREIAINGLQSLIKAEPLYIHNEETLESKREVLDNAKESYLLSLGFQENEKIILLVGTTLLSTGKIGFVLTDKGFYGKNKDGKSLFVPRADIKFFRRTGDSLCVDYTEDKWWLIDIWWLLNCNPPSLIADVLLLLHNCTFPYGTKQIASEDVLNLRIKKCNSCGNYIEKEKKFCSRCGNKLM